MTASARGWAVLLALGIMWLVACSSAGMPYCDARPVDGEPLSGYRLGPGDRLRVTVFRQPDLSAEFTIDGEGYLALPLAGAIAAGGLTTRQLEDRLEQGLRAEGLLVDPQVSVQLLTYRPVYVLGEINQPGSYEYRAGLSVVGVVALAGGFTYRAATSGITVARRGCRFAAEPDTPLAPDDIVKVPERFF